MWKKVKMWLNKPVTNNMLMKFMISLNVVVLCICWRFAYIGDIKDQEEQEYYQHLETMNDRYKEVLRMQGWICPKCGSVYGPQQLECYRCNKPEQYTVTATWSGSNDKKEEK